jgi:hypothetical protein
MLEIEARTPTLMLEFYLSAQSQLTVEGERRRLVMEQCERRTGAIGFSSGNGNHPAHSYQTLSCPYINLGYFLPSNSTVLAVKGRFIGGKAAV